MGERTVSIRELNQNAGRVVRSVATDGPVRITDHGNVVALLVEAPDSRSALQRLIPQGRVEAPPATLPKLPPARQREVSLEELIHETRGNH